MAPAEDAGALDDQDAGDEPEVGVEIDGKASEEDNGRPDESQRTESAGGLLEDGETEGEAGELILGGFISASAVGLDRSVLDMALNLAADTPLGLHQQPHVRLHVSNGVVLVPSLGFHSDLRRGRGRCFRW